MTQRHPDPPDRRRPELWNALQAFPFDEPGAPQPFSARLARENRWTPAYTRRVLEEYRRFLLLAATAGHPVSPSPAVDAAWHLHLCYTRSYWERLCGQVLGAPLHHEPAAGAPGEAARFGDWYRRTLGAYRREFGAMPPADIWPVPASAPAGRPRRTWAAAALTATALCAGCTVTGPAGAGLAILATVIVGGLAWAVLSIWSAVGRRRTGAEGTHVAEGCAHVAGAGGGCDDGGCGDAGGGDAGGSGCGSSGYGGGCGSN
jgi:hypothetical protein